MLVAMNCGKCDDCGKAATYAIVAQGATGRWCEVLGFCGDCVSSDWGEALSIEDARAKADGDGYADF